MPEKPGCFCCERLKDGLRYLTTEAVEGAALALECVDDIHGGNGLAVRVLCVPHGVLEGLLKEDLEDAAGFLVNQAADTLDATTAGQTAYGRLGDALDVFAQHVAVTLGLAALASADLAAASLSHA